MTRSSPAPGRHRPRPSGRVPAPAALSLRVDRRPSPPAPRGSIAQALQWLARRLLEREIAECAALIDIGGGIRPQRFSEPVPRTQLQVAMLIGEWLDPV